MMRAMTVTCAMLVVTLWFAAFTPANAGVPLRAGMTAAASAVSDAIVVKKGGVPGWWVKGRCPPGHWKKGWC
jgi:hypothetical protein